ncbi:hypothetical protein K9N50_05610 [bacterium]|nr:hypothetical protein [bacterium]
MIQFKSKVLIVVLLMLMTAMPAFCQLDVSGTMVTSYDWRGFDALNRGPAFQPSITYSAGEIGLSANVWGSWAVTQRDDAGIRDLDELDLTIAYERTVGNYGFSLGYIYYGFPSMEGYPDELSTNSEINLGITFEDIPYSPGISTYYALNDKSWDGLYVSISGSKTVQAESVDLNMTLSLGYSDQSLVTDLTDAGLSDVNLSIDTEFQSCNLSLSPSFTLTYVPMKEVYSDYLIFWCGLTIGWSKE